MVDRALEMKVSIKRKDETKRFSSVIFNVANRVGLLKHRLKIASGFRTAGGHRYI